MDTPIRCAEHMILYWHEKSAASDYNVTATAASGEPVAAAERALPASIGPRCPAHTNVRAVVLLQRHGN